MLKIAWFGDFREELGGQIFKIFFSKNVVGQKSKIQRGGLKKPSRGVGVDLNFKRGHKKSNQQRIYTPWHPLAHLCSL